MMEHIIYYMNRVLEQIQVAHTKESLDKKYSFMVMHMLGQSHIHGTGTLEMEQQVMSKIRNMHIARRELTLLRLQLQTIMENRQAIRQKQS